MHRRQHVTGNAPFVQHSAYIIVDKFGFKPWKTKTKVVLRVHLILKYHFNQYENRFVIIYSIIPLNFRSIYPPSCWLLIALKVVVSNVVVIDY